ncbi:TetR/AcrR family transcriptional regulator [Leucobacter chromiireducens]|uniref:TetR/AcrR family transcriptional regulator n=1 Tax=Leucobacter chromiireducens subsp. solipictus TaxID=398235 RepID=A0ABS1SFU9_9MICO|nr:TetR/AcrR family transcriptional regulator [Leucobacter chromiireducens]MBL3679192.1 TetR/AcrR family transcriptional regulator [Leucobacter chromiireducens subsp. solipictus]
MATDAASSPAATLRAADPRTARTREAIVTGFATLLRSGCADASVRDVVASAGISRASFYTHFAGVDEVALTLLRRIFEGLGAVVVAERVALGRRTATSVRAGQERLADAFWEQRDLLRPMLEGPSAGPVYVAIVRAFAETIEALLRSELSRIPAGIDARLAAIGIANTLLGILSAWITDAIVADREAVVDHLVAMLPAWIATPDSPDAH